MFRASRRAAIAVIVVAAVVVACGGGSSSGGPAGRTSPGHVASGSRPGSTAATPSGRTPAPSHTNGSLASFDPAGKTVAAEIALMGLAAPVDVTNAGDGSGRLFVLEQAGTVRVVRDGALVDRPFLDIHDRVASGGERGLLGLAFHPDYPKDPRFFVDYTNLDGNTVVASFVVDPNAPDVADQTSQTILLTIDQPYPNHNGGAVQFGPDGMLYIAMGDGGSGGDPMGNGQRLDTLLAKILRIDVDHAAAGKGYSVPADNPFVSTGNARPEIWLTGLRNPWRIRFDRATGDLWIGDVGQNAWEEVDVARAGTGGLDFGWNVMEGFHCFQPATGCDGSGLTQPVTEYGHEDGCAVIGGVVVRDERQAALDGGYLFGDACSDRVWLIDPASDGPQTPVVAARLGRTLSSIGEAEDGTVYATSLDHGELLRLSPGS